MGILQPWLLALGAAMAVPLLLHLFQRHQGPRVVFPAVRYLRRAEKESARRIRLRQWLLMALRLALVLLLTLAAARPFLLGAGAAHEPAAVVIVLDNSVSTSAVEGDRRVFDALRERALATLERAGPDDRFWLLRAASRGDPALPGDAAATARRVRETEPVAGAADLRGALTRARALLATGAEGRAPEIQLLSDLQATELRGLAAAGPAPPLVVWTPGGAAPANRAVADVSIGGGMAPIAGQRTQLVATIRGEAGSLDTVPVRVFVGDRLVAAARAPVNRAVVLPLPPAGTGVLHGRVETDPDALRADDVHHFAVRVLPPPVVAAPGASAFVAEAVRVLERSGRIRTTGGDPDVVLPGGPAAVAALGPGRTAVIVPPGSPVELVALNGALARAGVARRYTARPTDGATRLVVADSTDPLERALQHARIERNYAIEATSPQPGDSVLLRTTEGDAWVVRGESATGGRYILLGSPLDADATSIPTSAAMIPLLDRLLGAWSAPRGEASQADAGEELVLPPGTTGVRRPDGVLEGTSGAGYTAPPAAGVYKVLAGDAVVGAFAVNPPARESDLRRARAAGVTEAFTGWTLTTAASPAAWERAIYRARLGLELWRPLLLAALLLLATEAMVAASGATRKPNAAAPEAA